MIDVRGGFVDAVSGVPEHLADNGETRRALWGLECGPWVPPCSKGLEVSSRGAGDGHGRPSAQAPPPKPRMTLYQRSRLGNASTDP
jgi:hypothetical protein